MSEDDCFKKYLSLIQTKKHTQWQEQYKFVLDKKGNILVDFIGRFENFENDVCYVLRILNNQTSSTDKIHFETMPHLNQSSRTHYYEYYDSESKEIVEHLYKKDIELFNYTF